MKRFIAFILSLLMALSFVACSAEQVDGGLNLSEVSIGELQEELANRLAAADGDTPDKQDEDENLAASLKNRVSGDTAPSDSSTDTPSDSNDTAPTEPQIELEADPESDSVTVYVTKSGEKYHRDGCQYLRKSKIETTLSSAKDRGYTACSKCKPPV